MEKLIQFVEKMKPFFEKVSNNPYLRSVRDGFVSCIPVILFSVYEKIFSRRGEIFLLKTFSKPENLSCRKNFLCAETLPK